MYFNYHIGTHLLRPSPIITNISYAPGGTSSPLPLTPGVTETSVIVSPFDGNAVNTNFFNLAMSATDNTARIATLEGFPQTAISSSVGFVSYSGLMETSGEFYGGSPLSLAGTASQTAPLVLTLANPIAFQMAVGQGIIYNPNGTINTTLSAIRSITFGGGTGALSPYYFASTLDTYLTGLLAGNTKDSVNAFRINGTSGIGGNSSLWASTFGSISGGNPKSFYLYINDGYTASQNGSTLPYNPYITLSQAIPYNAGAGIFTLATVLQAALNNAISSTNAFTVNVINGGGDLQIVGSNDRTNGGIYQFTLQKDTVGDGGNNGILEWLQLFPVSGTSVQAWDLSSVINFQISGGLVGQTYNPFQLNIVGNGPYEYMYFIDQDSTFTVPGFLSFWGVTVSATTYYHTRHPAVADGSPIAYSTILNYGGDLWVRDAYVRNFSTSGAVTYGGSVTFSGTVSFSSANLTGNLTSSGNLSLTTGNLLVGGTSTLVGNTFIGNSNSPSTSNTQIYGNLTIGSAGIITTFNVFSAATFNSSVSFAPNTTIRIGNTQISSDSVNTSGSLSSNTATISSATINNLTVGTVTVTNQQYAGSNTLTTLTVSAGSTLGGITTANYLTFSSNANTPTGGAFYSADASRTNMPTTLGSGSSNSAIYNGDLIVSRLVTPQPTSQPANANLGDIILGGLLWMNQGAFQTPPSTSPVFYSGATLPVNSGTTANYNGPFSAYSISTVSTLTVGGALTTTNTTQIAGSFDVGASLPAHSNILHYDGNLYATTFFGTLIGSVQGGGGVTNYIGNGGFETGTITPWTAYANTVAGNIPTPSAQAGTIHVTLSTNSSNPIFGSYDGIIGKTAANNQGNGVYYDFTLDFGALTVTSQVLTVQIIYETGANYSNTSGDVALFVYDKGPVRTQFVNLQGATIGTTGVVLPASSSPVLLTTSFTTLNLSDTAYRLYLHVVGTGTTAWSGSYPATGIEIDGIAVSWANIPISQVAGSTNIGYPLYNATTKLSGAFYGGVTVPTDTTALNYDGNLQSTNFTTPGFSSVGYITVTGGASGGSGFIYSSSGPTPSHTTVTLNYDGNFVTTSLTTPAGGVGTVGNVTIGGVLKMANNNSITQAQGQFDTGNTAPSSGYTTSRINWEGNFYANNIFSTSIVSVGTNLAIGTGGAKTSGQFDGANIFPSDTAVYVNYDGYINATGMRVAQSGAFAFASGVSTLTTSITATVPGAARTYNLPDAGSNASILLAAASQAVGYFDTTGTNPASGATRLNWNGSLYTYNSTAINSFILGTGTSAITFSSSMSAASAVTFQNVAGTIPIIAAAQQSTGGFFDTSGSAPIHSTRLNYDGNFYTFALTTASNLTVGGGSKLAGAFDIGGVNPTDTNRLNYDGNFYATTHFGIFGNALAGTGNVSHGTTALATNSTGNNNTALGSGALNATTISSLTAVGYNSLTANTTGVFNTAVGYLALSTNTTGVNNTAIGYSTLSSSTVNYNTAVGVSALTASSGNHNTAVGNLALQGNTTGTFNTGVGSAALTGNTTGIQNTALGYNALDGYVISTSNVAIGYNALSSFSATLVSNNTAVGTSALAVNTASNNTAVGFSALAANTTGTTNVAVGYNALVANTTGSNNTSVGYATLAANNTGTQNVAIGYNALTGFTVASSNTAVGYNTLSATAAGPITNNTAIGANALAVNTGNNNTAVGFNALTANTTGIENSAIGNTALAANNTGSYNVAVGYGALSTNTTGIQNVAIGITSLQSAVIAQNNTAVGFGSLSAATGGSNTALGYNAGSNIIAGTSNVVIGAGGSASSASVTNEVTITDGTNFARFQGAAVAWTFTSDERDKTDIQNSVVGLDFLMKVQPKTYVWKHRSGAVSDGTIQLGFTAQSLDAAENTLPFPIGLVNKADPNQWTIAQTNLIPVMVNAIKELKAEVDELKKQLAAK